MSVYTCFRRKKKFFSSCHFLGQHSLNPISKHFCLYKVMVIFGFPTTDTYLNLLAESAKCSHKNVYAKRSPHAWLFLGRHKVIQPNRELGSAKHFPFFLFCTQKMNLLLVASNVCWVLSFFPFFSHHKKLLSTVGFFHKILTGEDCTKKRTFRLVFFPLQLWFNQTVRFP